ncbi:hypothetical protein CR513_10035, partial [Mucuna pruriens]
MVHEIGVASNLRLENQLSELTSLVRQLAVGQHQPNMAAKVCGILAENSIARQFSISRGPNEATCSQQFESTGSNNLPLQTIPNPRGNVSAVTLRSGKELSPLASQLPRSTKADSKPDANSQVQQQEKIFPLSFPTRTISVRKSESAEELLKMFRKVEINIPLLDAIKKIPTYAKFLKELCVHKRKKMQGSVEVGGIVSALTKNEDFTTGAQALPKKCLDPGIFSIPCTIGEYTFANAMLDLGASINVMPTLTYKALNFGDLECTRMTIQLANISIVQPLGVLEDVLVQVNELIFPGDFYVLDMKDETSGQGSTLILGRPFLMTARTKINVHVGTISMEFGDTLVQFNIFEAMKHPTEDHSLFGINLIDELLGPKATNVDAPSSPPPMELKPLPGHLKYAYLDTEQQLPEDKLLQVLRQHKKTIGWKLSDLPGINPSICMHRISVEEVAKPKRQQQRRMNPTILDVVKKEVTKLLTVGIIYPISDSQWVSPVQVVPKKV